MMIACHEKINFTIINRLPFYFYYTRQPSLVTVVKFIGILSLFNQLITWLHILSTIQLLVDQTIIIKLNESDLYSCGFVHPLSIVVSIERQNPALAKVQSVRGERIQHSKVTNNISPPLSNENYTILILIWYSNIVTCFQVHFVRNAIECFTV